MKPQAGQPTSMAPDPAERSGTRPARPATADSAASSGLGHLLKGAREGRGLTIDQAAAETRIRRRYLEALESDRLDALPGGFYQRALLRTYARALRLDERMVLDRLDQAIRPQPARSARWSVSSGSGRGFRGGRALILAGVLVGVVIGARAIGGRQSPAASPAPPAVEPAEPAAPVPVAPVAGGPSAMPTPPAAVSPPPPAVAPLTVAPAGAASPAQPETPSAAIAATAPTPEITPTPAPPSAAVAATPVAPPVPAAPLPGLVLRTEPAGARVTVDGIGWGISPVTIRHLPPGDKRVRVSKDGYATVERSVRIVDGRPTVIDLQLQPLP